MFSLILNTILYIANLVSLAFVVFLKSKNDKIILFSENALNPFLEIYCLG